MTPSSEARKRRFSRQERAALYLAASGECALCGVDLQKSWHADHVAPYSHGGETDVANGQALCPACNLKKGNMANDRQWQKEFQTDLLTHVSSGVENYLCSATPAAGKTRAAILAAIALLHNGTVKRVVVVVPSDHLRRQWMQKAAPLGLQLDSDWTGANGPETSDYRGITVTYHSVPFGALIHRKLCADKDTLVIFDEIHHVGDKKTWGDAIFQAFGKAKVRLGLSGTPFRSDNKPIPFVKYETTGDGGHKSLSDFTYGYPRALDDGICRYVYFPTIEGTMKWQIDGATYEATFADGIPEPEKRNRLATALMPNGGWMSKILRMADTKLTKCREIGSPDAAGLVIAKDKDHAREISKVLRAITGQDPALVISGEAGEPREAGEPDAAVLLAQFEKSNRRWVVSVRMVSEGVDIPRIRVVVFVTNWETEMFFRQSVGRAIRMTDDDPEPNAFFYIPATDTFVKHAKAIMEERDHYIMEEEDEPELRGPNGNRSSLMSPYYIASEAVAHDVIAPNATIDQNYMQRAESLRLSVPGSNGIHTEVIARFLKADDAMRGGTATVVATAPAIVEPQPMSAVETKLYLRQKLSKLTSKRDIVLGLEPGTTAKDMVRLTGIKVNKATNAQLKERIAIVERMVREAK